MDNTILISLITAAGGAIAAFARWAVRLWAQVRREDIEAARETAIQGRAANDRMVEALLESARAQTALAGKIDQLPEMLELLMSGWRAVTSPPAAPNSALAEPHGFESDYDTGRVARPRPRRKDR